MNSIRLVILQLCESGPGRAPPKDMVDDVEVVAFEDEEYFRQD